MMKIASKIESGDQILLDGGKATVVSVAQQTGIRTPVVWVTAENEAGALVEKGFAAMHLVRVW